ncbi:MAG TPA: ABC transporter ATP-binding protein [Magnetospirillum sp.]|nr:ABC transporter ATP-binding protein [Magnetospirillum sp.]
MTELIARQVTRELPGPVPVTLVRGIDLEVHPGEFVAITGPSGSGKSSLLYLLGLLDRPTAGTIVMDGLDTTTLTADQAADLRLARLGFVFQFHFLLPEFSAQTNVEIPMRKLGRLDDRAARRRAQELLDMLGLADHRGKRPDQLSGGQRQRVAIARALANDPPVLLADEPTGNLDSHSAQVVFELFRDLAHDQGRSVVAVTHDVQLAALADRRVTLVDGSIVTT